MHICSLRIWQVEARRSGVQDHTFTHLKEKKNCRNGKNKPVPTLELKAYLVKQTYTEQMITGLGSFTRPTETHFSIVFAPHPFE